MTFDEWWKAGTSVEVPLYGEANAKKAWDYQQDRIAELEAELAKLRRGVDNIQARSYELGQRELHDMAKAILEGEV